MAKPGEEKELDKLRKTIEEYRAKAERNGGAFAESKSVNSTPQGDAAYSDFGSWSAPSAFSAPTLSIARNYETLSPNSTINKRISSGSLSSMSSHASHSSVSSSGSGSSADNEQRHNRKKRWLPLKSAFSRSARSSQSSGTTEFGDHDDSGYPFSPATTKRLFQNVSDETHIDRASFNAIMRIVQEKDRKLTDVRLEALTSQHQLHQLKDQVAQMQHEMQLLRMENERLQTSCNNCRKTDFHASSSLKLQLSPLSSVPPPPMGSSNSTEDMTLSFLPGVAGLDCFKLHQLASPGHEDEGTQMKFIVSSPQHVLYPTQHHPPAEIVVGSVPLSRKINWEELDRVTSELFLEYCRCIDGDDRLGLTASSISFYKVGEQNRVPGTNPPELLPCAFIIGTVDTVEIFIKDASCGCLDLMAFRSLIAKGTLLQYTSTLLQKRRVILCGPSGTGKTALAYSLANHVVARERKHANIEDLLHVYNVKQQGEEELKSFLKTISEKCDVGNDHVTLPHVIIVENCFMLTSLDETFSSLLTHSEKRTCPYLIGTMLQSKLNRCHQSSDAFEWISCTNNSQHVKDYLAKHLRRALIESEITDQLTSDDDFQNVLRVITWLPLCWHHVNRCLEGQSAGDVTIGPRVFASCPNDFYSSCSWFVQVWNHVITPYVAAAVRKVRQTQSEDEKETIASKWSDPTNWVVESFPWNASDMGCDNTLRLKQITIDDLKSPSVPLKPDQVPLRSKSIGNRKHISDNSALSTKPHKIDAVIRDVGSITTQATVQQQSVVPAMELMEHRVTNHHSLKRPKKENTASKCSRKASFHGNTNTPL